MKLLVLVACLLIERFLHIGNILSRFSWFESYLKFIKSKIKESSPFSKGIMGLFVIFFPLCLPVILSGIYIVDRQVALSGYGLYFIVLLYCFGPTDLYYQLSLYFKAVEEGDKEHQMYSYNEMIDNDEDSENGEGTINEKDLLETIFVRANCGVFGIVFWYCFGPLSFVLIYRGLCLMSSLIYKEKDVTKPFEDIVPTLYGWLNWIPSRVMALLYVIAGGFQAFSIWKSLVFTGPVNNQTILIQCGVNSLAKDKQLPSLEATKHAVVLVNRSFIIFTVLMFVFFLGGWMQ